MVLINPLVNSPYPCALYSLHPSIPQSFMATFGASLITITADNPKRLIRFLYIFALPLLITHLPFRFLSSPFTSSAFILYLLRFIGVT